jgi:hypothetical protein
MLKSQACPKCGSHDRIPIVYGYPTKESMARAGRGELALGGCLVDDRNPRWECRACGTRWGPRGIVEAED